MLTEHAKVIAVDEDGLWVETLKQSACGACSAKSGCGQHLLASYMRDMTCIKAKFQRLPSQTIWKPGDDVTIGVNEKALVYNALLLYLLPLTGLLFAAALAWYFQLNDLLIAATAFGGLFTSAWFLKRYYARLADQTVANLHVLVLDP